MKERYFTHLSLETQASELYRQAIGHTRNKISVFTPVQSVLLVLDMQAYFLNPESHAFIPSAEAIVEGIARLIETFSSYERPIIFTQHINSENNAGMMASWWKDLITIENPLSQVIPEIDVTKGQLIQKSQYDAFYQTPLDEILRREGIGQVVTCGVMTHLCCETTARSAFMHGYEVFFPIDGTATYNLDFHRASLTNLAHGFANLVLVKDILEAMWQA